MVQKSGRERCDGSSLQERKEAPKRQIPCEVQQCVYFDGDYDSTCGMLRVETRFSGLRQQVGTKYVLCCAYKYSVVSNSL